jgi:hypothetical protein
MKKVKSNKKVSDINQIYEGFVLAQKLSNQAVRNALKGKLNK